MDQYVEAFSAGATIPDPFCEELSAESLAARSLFSCPQAAAFIRMWTVASIISSAIAIHLVLKSTAGSWLRAGDEEVTMREGELWWFDNKAVHEAWNKGGDRIHLIFDVLSREKKAELESVMVMRGAAPIADPRSGSVTRSGPPMGA